MMGMLIGGTLVFALIVVGVMMAMRDRDEAAPPPTVAAPVIPGVEPAPPVVDQTKSDSTLLAEAEPVVRAFLEAKEIDEILPLVRNREQAEPRIRAFYADGKIDAPGMDSYNESAALGRQGKALSVDVRTRDFDVRTIAFFDTPEGIKIDWESCGGLVGDAVVRVSNQASHGGG